MQGIDVYQHFWNFDLIRDNCITDEMPVIRKDFLPQHLQPSLKENGFAGCITIQSEKSENIFQLPNVEKHNFIRRIETG